MLLITLADNFRPTSNRVSNHPRLLVLAGSLTKLSADSAPSWQANGARNDEKRPFIFLESALDPFHLAVVLFDVLFSATGLTITGQLTSPDYATQQTEPVPTITVSMAPKNHAGHHFDVLNNVMQTDSRLSLVATLRNPLHAQLHLVGVQLIS
jgi:hypothetical protein